MAHAAGDPIAGANSAFLRCTDQAVLRFADHSCGDLIGMTLVDEIDHPDHLVFFIAQNAADYRAGQLDRRLFQGLHCHQHGRQIALGIVGAATIHPATHNFGTKRVILPDRDIPRCDHVCVALKHECAFSRAAQPADDDIGPVGGNRVDLNVKSL